MDYIIFLFVFTFIIWFNLKSFVEHCHALKINCFKVNELYNYIIPKEPLTYNDSFIQLCIYIDQFKNKRCKL
jgi:hypothetical protein